MNRGKKILGALLISIFVLQVSSTICMKKQSPFKSLLKKLSTSPKKSCDEKKKKKDLIVDAKKWLEEELCNGNEFIGPVKVQKKCESLLDELEKKNKYEGTEVVKLKNSFRFICEKTLSNNNSLNSLIIAEFKAAYSLLCTFKKEESDDENDKLTSGLKEYCCSLFELEKAVNNEMVKSKKRIMNQFKRLCKQVCFYKNFFQSNSFLSDRKIKLFCENYRLKNLKEFKKKLKDNDVLAGNIGKLKLPEQLCEKVKMSVKKLEKELKEERKDQKEYQEFKIPFELLRAREWLEGKLKIIDEDRNKRVGEKFKFFYRQLLMQKGRNKEYTLSQLKQLCIFGFVSVQHPGDRLRRESDEFCSSVSDEKLKGFFDEYKLKDFEGFKKKLMGNKNGGSYNAQGIKALYDFGSKLVSWKENSLLKNIDGLFSDKMLLSFFQMYKPKDVRDFEQKLKEAKVSIYYVSSFKLSKELSFKLKNLIEKVEQEIIDERKKKEQKEEEKNLRKTKSLAQISGSNFNGGQPGMKKNKSVVLRLVGENNRLKRSKSLLVPIKEEMQIKKKTPGLRKRSNSSVIPSFFNLELEEREKKV